MVTSTSVLPAILTEASISALYFSKLSLSRSKSSFSLSMSSLSVAIAYPDVFMVSRTIMNNAGHALPMLFLILITFLGLSLFISLFMNFLNRRVTRIGA